MTSVIEGRPAGRPSGGFVIFLLYVGVFVACSCVVLPLSMFAVCAMRMRKRKTPRPVKDSRLSLPATDGVR